MRSPSFVADFDSSTALVRALSASLRGRRFARLGRGRLAGALTNASSILPEPARLRAFTLAGRAEAIPPARLADVSPDEFAAWVTRCYPERAVPAVAIGSADGAVLHLLAAAGIPWLPQTFLVPVARRADPDDVAADVDLGRRTAPPLLAAHPDLELHQMHDANQDRLMVRRLAYFRMKLLALPAAYKRFISRVLAPEGQLVVIDDELRWPAACLGERHFFQAGAVGGLRPREYVHGSPRVERFLATQGSSARKWRFPPIDAEVPEAEWGYAAQLDGDVRAFAAGGGYRVVRLRVARPGAASGAVADLFRGWLASLGTPPTRLLAETFICVEPRWALSTRSVPWWAPFAVEECADDLERYLSSRPDWDDIAITLFAHGVRSAGIAPAPRWRELASRARHEGRLVGVRAGQWPADFAALARYSGALDRVATPSAPPPQLAWETARHFPDVDGLAWEDM